MRRLLDILAFANGRRMAAAFLFYFFGSPTKRHDLLSFTLGGRSGQRGSSPLAGRHEPVGGHLRYRCDRDPVPTLEADKVGLTQALLAVKVTTTPCAPFEHHSRLLCDSCAKSVGCNYFHEY